MNWWEEAEAKARRGRTPAGQALTLWQRMLAVGIDSELAQTPAYDLAHLYQLCADLVVLVDGLLSTADSDTVGVRRHGLGLFQWAGYADSWARSSALAFNQLMDSLDLDAATLAQREKLPEEAGSDSPEEEAKLSGRYRHWHLLYERLDLKLASMGLEAGIHRGLARTIARLYEECLVTILLVAGLEKESKPHFRRVAKVLLDINTVWHFDLGCHLGQWQLRAKGQGKAGLITWLLLAFGNPVPSAGS